MSSLDYTDVKNPRWGNADKTEIMCEVQFAVSPHPSIEEGAYLPFCAMKEDPHGHGGEIFDKCVAGDYGKVGKYIAPKIVEEIIDPLEKLKKFLIANPDVKDLLK